MTAYVPKILVVDDEPDMVVFLCAWLEDNGYVTNSANDGRQALQSILDWRPDLVLIRKAGHGLSRITRIRRGKARTAA
jgi:CheY-like chemotaxis protein